MSFAPAEDDQALANNWAQMHTQVGANVPAEDYEAPSFGEGITPSTYEVKTNADEAAMKAMEDDLAARKQGMGADSLWEANKDSYADGGEVEGYATKGAVKGQKQYKQPIGPQDRPWERWVPSGYNSHEEVPIVNPQDLVGKRVGSLLADLTRAGGYYSGIDSSKIQNPEPMLGGPGYPLLPENQKYGLGWAVQGKGKGTAKLNKDFDYIAVHAMNPNSHLSNASMSNAVAKTMQAYMRDGRLSPDAVSKINDLIRSGAVNKKGEINTKHQSLQDFPGFDHPEIQRFMKDMSFESRLKMYNILGQAKAEKLGAPSIEKIRRDTLELARV